jgi:hypothetical protein
MRIVASGHDAPAPPALFMIIAKDKLKRREIMSNPSSTASATATAVDTQTQMFRLPSPQITLPIVAILGYAAFLVTGFGAGLGPAQPLPVYAFIGLLLLALQAIITEDHSVSRLLYIFITSGFALVYAAEVYFNQAQNFATSSTFYLVYNTLLIGIFIYDAITRRFRTTTPAGKPLPASALPPRNAFAALAADFAGFAVLMYVVYGLLTIISSVPVGRQHTPIDLSLQSFGINFGPNITTLPALDLVLGIAASAIGLLLTGIVGVLAVAGQPITPDSPEQGARTFGGNLIRIATQAVNQVLLSLRLALSPLVWLIPSFSIARFSDLITQYLNNSARLSQSTILDLFNPFSPQSIKNYPNALEDFVLLLVSAAAVVLAVAVVEHDLGVIKRTLQVLGVTGQVVAYTLVFFTLSLAAVNALLIKVGTITVEPFQIGGVSLIALIAGGILSIYVAIMPRPKPSTPPPAAGA